MRHAVVQSGGCLELPQVMIALLYLHVLAGYLFIVSSIAGNMSETYFWLSFVRLFGSSSSIAFDALVVVSS